MVSKSLRVNEQIRIPQVRLIDQDNHQVGVVNTVEALNMARQAGLDLVEVSPDSSPSVCRIMDFGKWKYSQKKKDHRAKVKQHQVVLKEIRLRPKIEDHDKMVKIKKCREFFEKHSKVQFTMMFRGREMAHKEIAEELFADIIEQLQDVGKVESPAKLMGKRMIMVMAPAPQQAKKPGTKTKSSSDEEKGVMAPLAIADQVIITHTDTEEEDAQTENA